MKKYVKDTVPDESEVYIVYMAISNIAFQAK